MKNAFVVFLFELTLFCIFSLISEMNLAELTSLEQLLGTMLSRNLISSEVIELLWAIFCKSTL
jgi:hypothetical protein